MSSSKWKNPDTRLPQYDKPPIYDDLDRILKRVEDLEAKISPIEPLLDLEMSSRLIPYKLSSLRSLLKENKDLFPPIYKLNHERKRIRLLPVSHIRKIRKMVLRGEGVGLVL